MNMENFNLTESKRTRLCVVLTYFNRKEKTLACFRALSRAALPNTLDLSAVVIDDGSTDGTADLLFLEFPWVQVIRSSGNLYWARGMHQAIQVAMQSDYDFYLWLNDDTMLYADALSRLLDCEAVLGRKGNSPVIVVGSTVDENTGLVTYGGELRVSRIRKMRFKRIKPSDVAQTCESMNGNTVLISRNALQIVGNVEAAFEHAMGDTDYALRANKSGVGVWVAPGVHGTCSGNSVAGTYMDDSLALGRRWRLMMSRKGLPWRSWLILTRRHAGLAWPLYFVWPYLSLLLGQYRSIAKPQ